MNLSKCTRCNKTTMDEEYFDHDCNPEIKNDKTMEIAYYRIDKDSQNRDRLTVLTMGGILYDMPIISENKEQTKIPYDPENQASTDTQQPQNNRRPNRISIEIHEKMPLPKC